MTTTAAVDVCNHIDPNTGGELDAIDASFYRRALGNTLVHPAVRYSKGFYEGQTVWFYNVYRPCQAQIVHVIRRRRHSFTRTVSVHFVIRITDTSHPFYREGSVIDDIGATQLVDRCTSQACVEHR